MESENGGGIAVRGGHHLCCTIKRESEAGRVDGEWRVTVRWIFGGGQTVLWRKASQKISYSPKDSVQISSTRSVRVDRRFEVGSESEAGVPHSCHAYQDINWSQ